MNKIIHGDCLKELKKVPDNSVDLVCTDPPYNVGYKYAEYRDNMSADSYLAWQLLILRECQRILKSNGSLFYLNYPEFNSLLYVELSRGFDLTPIEIIAWVYNTHTSGKPLRKAFRTWLWASKGAPASHFEGEYKNPNDKRVARLIADGRKPNEYDWWHFEQVKNVSREKTAHPCQLPFEMVSKIIVGTTNRDDLVVDPFLGSGTTAAVAKSLGRRYIGIDSDLDYIRLAKERLSTTQLELAA